MGNISQINGLQLTAATASYAATASFIVGTVTSASYAVSSSFATTASYVVGSSTANTTAVEAQVWFLL